MKCPHLLAGKGKLICFFLLLLFCFSTTKSFSQVTTINYLTSSLSLSNCNVFLGSPTVNGIVHNSLAGGVTNNNTTGIFLATTPGNTSPGGTAYVINYPFVQGDNYTISIVTNGGDGSVNLFAEVVSSLNSFPTSNNASCTPDNDVLSYRGAVNEFAGIPSGSKTNTVLPWNEAFNFNYLVIWASGGNTSLSEDGFSISEVIITQSAQGAALCTFTAPTNLSTSNNGTTLNWVGSGNGNIADLLGYKIAVTDESGGVNYTSNLVSSGLSVNFCPKASGDNVTFTVTPYCIGGSTGTTSAPYSYSYTAVPLATPTDITYAPLNTLSWTAVPDATSYLVVVKNMATGGGNPYVTTGNSVSGSDAELTTGQTYEVQVTAQGCVTGAASPWSGSFTVVQPCPVPQVYNVEPLNAGEANVAWSAVSGAASYNIKFVDGSNTTLFSNFVPVPPGNGGTFSGIPAGTYTVSVQANCTTGYSGAWGSYFLNVAINSTASRATSWPGAFGINGINSPDSLNGFQLYPVPSSTQVNILYSTMQNGKADIMIVNEVGTTVIHKAISAIAGPNTYSISVSGLANGIYFVKLTDGRYIYVRKLLVQK